MKFLTLIFCAAALTASSAYGMKTPATAHTPKKSSSWQKHALLGAAKLAQVTGHGLAAYYASLNIYRNLTFVKNPADARQQQPAPLFNSSIWVLFHLGGLTTFGHSAYKSLSKAYTKYQEA